MLVAQAPDVIRPRPARADDQTETAGQSARADVRAPAGAEPPGAEQPAPEQPAALVIPPPPARAAPRLAVEVHTGLTLPLDNRALCPREHGCVLQPGGGVGVSLEWRTPSGFGALVAYDTWFLDSDSVYELAVQQALRTGVRYTMPTDYVFHPIFELSLGVMGLGDTFQIATVGVVGQAFAGAETELTESFGVRFGFGLRAFSHSPFRTERDGVQRADDGVFSEAFFAEVGLTLM
ncbi:MAG: hypothetical protein ABW252_13715 [Polyangiales bacterium]